MASLSRRRTAVAGAALLAVLGTAGVAQHAGPTPTQQVAVIQVSSVHAPTPVVPRADLRAPRTRPVQPVRKPVATPVSKPASKPQITRPTPPRRPVFNQAVAQQRGTQALASLQRRLPSGWTVTFAVYKGSYVGFADSQAKVVTLWVKPGDSQQSLRITLAHELGHVLDYTRLSKAGRADYLELRDRSGHRGTWYPCNGCEDYDSAAGDFAEVYAYWLAGAGDFRSRFSPEPTSAKLQRLGAFFTQLERAAQV